MTDHPKPCHHNRHLSGRATLREHTDTCPNPSHCRGCQPCPATHCGICNRSHLQPDQALTCTRCQASIGTDLDELLTLNKALYAQAVYADGLRAAAAPIPGANPTVLVSPFTFPHELKWSATWQSDNAIRNGHTKDPMPPLATLAGWEDIWREWLHQADGPRRATLTNCVRYFTGTTDTPGALPAIAQASALRLDGDGTVQRPPDFPEFARDVATVRNQLEHAVHNEREPERGVECFECGDQLVRRYRTPTRCDCPPPPVLAHEPHTERRIVAGGDWMGTRYQTTPTQDRCCVACQRETEWQTRHVGHDQGGIADPTPGVSWDCPTCRMTYDPGGYVRAVRQALLDHNEDNLGWATFPHAAEAAATLTDKPITTATIRKWIDRGDEIGVVCEWRPGARSGRQMVFWPDVAARLAETRRPGRKSRVA